MQLSLNKLPWYGQLGVFVAISVMASGAYLYFYDSAMRTDLTTKEKQLTGLRAEITRGRAMAARLPEFRVQVADLEARLDGLKAVLPEQKDVGDLLRRIQTLATQSNLDIRGFSPRPIAQKEMYAEWPIALELNGSYHDLGIFFDKVGKMPRIINVNNIAIKARPGKARSEEAATISANCMATTFVLSDKPAPVDAKKKGKAVAQKR
jgi:type IV pilus assembly protein PilO